MGTSDSIQIDGVFFTKSLIPEMGKACPGLQETKASTLLCLRMEWHFLPLNRLTDVKVKELQTLILPSQHRHSITPPAMRFVYVCMSPLHYQGTIGQLLLIYRAYLQPHRLQVSMKDHPYEAGSHKPTSRVPKGCKLQTTRCSIKCHPGQSVHPFCASFPCLLNKNSCLFQTLEASLCSHWNYWWQEV